MPDKIRDALKKAGTDTKSGKPGGSSLRDILINKDKKGSKK